MLTWRRLVLAFGFLVLMTGCGEPPHVEDDGSGNPGASGGEDDTPPTPPGPPPAPPGTPRDSLAVYMTGHSLINLDMPRYLNEIASGNGKDHEYNLQMGIGSNMAWRLGGEGAEQDRDGNVLTYDALDEIGEANTISRSAYDAIVITEAVTLWNNVVFSRTIPNTVTYASALTNENPNGRAYLYDSWDSIETAGGTAAEWVSHTRAQYDLWRCVAAAASADPAMGGRPIELASGGQLMAAVAEAAIAGSIPGVTATQLFHEDGHHLSDLGNYVIALGLYGLLYNESVADSPSTFQTNGLVVDPAAARAIEQVVGTEVARLRGVSANPPQLSSCGDLSAATCPVGAEHSRICMEDLREVFE